MSIKTVAILSGLLSVAVHAMPAAAQTVTVIASPTSLFTGFGPVVTDPTTSLFTGFGPVVTNPTTSLFTGFGPVVTAMSSDEIMSMYSSMTSSINDDMGSQMTSSMSSAMDEMNKMQWYASWYMSMSAGSTTVNGMTADVATVTMTV